MENHAGKMCKFRSKLNKFQLKQSASSVFKLDASIVFFKCIDILCHLWRNQCGDGLAVSATEIKCQATCKNLEFQWSFCAGVEMTKSETNCPDAVHFSRARFLACCLRQTGLKCMGQNLSSVMMT